MGIQRDPVSGKLKRGTGGKLVRSDALEACCCGEGTVGSCCVDGVCDVVTPTACEADGGVYIGGAGCIPDPCPGIDPEGACCVDDTCITATSAGCASLAGIYLGDDTDCDPNPCDSPAGSCDICNNVCFEDDYKVFVWGLAQNCAYYAGSGPETVSYVGGGVWSGGRASLGCVFCGGNFYWMASLTVEQSSPELEECEFGGPSNPIEGWKLIGPVMDTTSPVGLYSRTPPSGCSFTPVCCTSGFISVTLP